MSRTDYSSVVAIVAAAAAIQKYSFIPSSGFGFVFGGPPSLLLVVSRKNVQQTISQQLTHFFLLFKKDRHSAQHYTKIKVFVCSIIKRTTTTATKQPQQFFVVCCYLSNPKDICFLIYLYFPLYFLLFLIVVVIVLCNTTSHRNLLSCLS